MKNLLIALPAVRAVQRRSAWIGLALLGVATFFAAPAVAAPGGTIALAIDTSLRAHGEGLVWRDRVVARTATTWLEQRGKRAEATRRVAAVDGALATLDAGHRAEAFHFSAASAFAENRVILRTRLHLTRQAHGVALGLSQPNPYQAFPELALALRLTHDFSLGAEYRFTPDNRNPAGPFGAYARDGAWKDVYLAWTPNRHFSLTASYVDLGRLGGYANGGVRQSGHYLAAEFWY
ncbi:DUF3034 family protein [Piscinibacter sakaiensis]|uniref:DUF3034 family protein n=1 Tax=Piscinibacter sakaiensis TaxID=1547922 RepID=UPI003AAD2A04